MHAYEKAIEPHPDLSHRWPLPVRQDRAAELHRAWASLAEAAGAEGIADRYRTAQLAALRGAGALLALRARPGAATGRPRNAWDLLARVAPEFAAWAAFFAATQHKSTALRFGGTGLVTAGEADDLLRDTARFLELVSDSLRAAGSARVVVR